MTVDLSGNLIETIGGDHTETVKGNLTETILGTSKIDLIFVHH